jgi:hypothetical protein
MFLLISQVFVHFLLAWQFKGPIQQAKEIPHLKKYFVPVKIIIFKLSKNLIIFPTTILVLTALSNESYKNVNPLKKKKFPSISRTCKSDSCSGDM